MGNAIRTMNWAGQFSWFVGIVALCTVLAGPALAEACPGPLATGCDIYCDAVLVQEGCDYTEPDCPGMGYCYTREFVMLDGEQSCINPCGYYTEWFCSCY